MVRSEAEKIWEKILKIRQEASKPIQDFRWEANLFVSMRKWTRNFTSKQKPCNFAANIIFFAWICIVSLISWTASFLHRIFPQLEFLGNVCTVKISDKHADEPVPHFCQPISPHFTNSMHGSSCNYIFICHILAPLLSFSI